MKLIYYFIHLLIGCPEEDLDYRFHKHQGVCRKCGRVHFIFNKYND